MDFVLINVDNFAVLWKTLFDFNQSLFCLKIFSVIDFRKPISEPETQLSAEASIVFSVVRVDSNRNANSSISNHLNVNPILRSYEHVILLYLASIKTEVKTIWLL
ncbi:hypothetical protein AWN68_02190 [Roseivirga echinicomitans]|uniref:Uncharacterized protein n=1 Tax=Roseivirga echinicomitans TaxID=296218 RepID=A0A150XYF4_9BACT|nr:hypothetical protein AWN68_02190 [Roseivirga echinicomitans]